nr:MAG TPA: hypothetical protein [Caudoviricetes sp.]
MKKTKNTTIKRLIGMLRGLNEVQLAEIERLIIGWMRMRSLN